MKFLLVTLCVFAVVIPSALSLECYVCYDDKGNCLTGKTKCSSEYNTCSKAKLGDAITKKCTDTTTCNTAKDFCKKTGECEAWCCDSDLCNGGVPLKPVTFLTLLAMALGVAKYLM